MACAVPVFQSWESVPRLDRFVIVMADIYQNTSLKIIAEILGFFMGGGNMEEQIVHTMCKDLSYGMLPAMDPVRKDKIVAFCVEFWYYHWYPSMSWSLASPSEWENGVMQLMHLCKLRQQGMRTLPSTTGAHMFTSHNTNVTLMWDLHFPSISRYCPP